MPKPKYSILLFTVIPAPQPTHKKPVPNRATHNPNNLFAFSNRIEPHLNAFFPPQPQNRLYYHNFFGLRTIALRTLDSPTSKTNQSSHTNPKLSRQFNRQNKHQTQETTASYATIADAIVPIQDSEATRARARLRITPFHA